MPQHKRGPWSQQEDQLLLHLVTVHGASNWVRISTQIQTRSPKQCRERFHQNLKPNLNHEPITPDEGIMIEQMVAEMGKRWAEIARRLRGRSDNAVKNWWNGGMNRRRRSNQQRRTELEVRHQVHPVHGHAHPQMQSMPPSMQHQQPLPPAFQHLMPQQFFAQPMWHPGHAPQHMGAPSHIPSFARHGMIETPLPSPSAFSQMSAEGAPSLVSDCSSMSTRSPHNGASPIELPPLADARDERRRVSAPTMRMGMPGSYHVMEAECNMPHMQTQRYGEMYKPQPMLQEPFMAHMHALPQPTSFLPSQPRQPSPMQQQFHVPAKNMSRQQSTYQLSQQQRMPSTPATMQLPSISKFAPNENQADPNMGTPMSHALTLEGSPKDKMSLSNLTT